MVCKVNYEYVRPTVITSGLTLPDKSFFRYEMPTLK